MNLIKTRREWVCFFLGGLLSASVIWACRPAGLEVPGPGSGSLAATRSAARNGGPATDAEEDGGIGGKLRRLAREDGHRRVEEDWETVARALQAKGGNKALVHSLLPRLNSEALGHLAAQVTAGLYTFEKQRLACAVYERWGEVDFPAAMAQAQRLDRGLRWACGQTALVGLSNVHPAEVCEYLIAPPTDDAQYELRLPNYRFSLLSQTTENWGRQDPAAAGAFILQHPAVASDSSYAAVAVAETWAAQDPGAALAWAAQLPAKSRDEATTRILKSWSETDLSSALAYSSNLPAGQAKDDLLGLIGTSWGQQNPAEAIRWAEAQGNNALCNVVGGWSEQDPAGAVAWIAQRPDLPFDPSIWGGLTDGYMVADPAGALQWINGLPGGRQRDAAIASYARGAATEQEILTALNLAQTVSTQPMRDGRTADALNSWLHIQPAAAHQWMSQANLSPEVIQRLRYP